MKPIEKEILRYLGYKKASPPEEEVLCAIAECREQAARLQPRHIWTELPIQCNLEKKSVKIGEEWVHSSDFTRYISGCIGTVVLAATLGWGKMTWNRVSFRRHSPSCEAVLHELFLYKTAK